MKLRNPLILLSVIGAISYLAQSCKAKRGELAEVKKVDLDKPYIFIGEFEQLGEEGAFSKKECTKDALEDKGYHYAIEMIHWKDDKQVLELHMCFLQGRSLKKEVVELKRDGKQLGKDVQKIKSGCLKLSEYMSKKPSKEIFIKLNFEDTDLDNNRGGKVYHFDGACNVGSRIENFDQPDVHGYLKLGKYSQDDKVCSPGREKEETLLFVKADLRKTNSKLLNSATRDKTQCVTKVLYNLDRDSDNEDDAEDLSEWLLQVAEGAKEDKGPFSLGTLIGLPKTGQTWRKILKCGGDWRDSSRVCRNLEKIEEIIDEDSSSTSSTSNDRDAELNFSDLDIDLN